MEPHFSFGSWINRRRRSLALTQNELAQRAGYSVVTIRKVEAGDLRPSVELAQQLAEALKITPEQRKGFVQFARNEFDPEPPPLEALTPPIAPWSLPQPPPTNVPTPLTSLVGREQEVTEIVNLLLRPDIRLVTLTGVGGTGKTRLSIEVARRIYEGASGGDGASGAHLDVKDGVFFVDLASLREPDLVLSAIVHSLDLRGQGGPSLLDMLRERLRGKNLLLVLDNFEHLIAAATTITDLLRTTPGLKIIVTSRRSLRLRGEREYAVLPLMAPEPTPFTDWLNLAQCEAVKLFIQHTLYIKPDFAATVEHIQAVAAICHRLDGLPLAIELAAAKMKVFSPQMLLQRLDRRLPLLNVGTRDLPERQQTMQNTIAWSYDLLTAPEKTLFARIAVFAGGCTLAAAETVCNTDSAIAMDVLDGLSSLVDQCLLQVETSVTEPRFIMLQTIQEFALERLCESGEEELIRRQHARYYLYVTSGIDPKARDGKLAVEFKQLVSEQDNLRSALQWCLLYDEPKWALQLAARLSGFWEFFGDLSEGHRWLSHALSAAQSLVPDAAWADALYGCGTLLLRQGNHDEAARFLYATLTFWQTVGDQWGIAHVFNYLAILFLEKGELQAATKYLLSALSLFRELDFKTGVGISIGNLALVSLMAGDYEEGQRLAQEAMEIICNLDDALYMGMASGTLGLSLLFCGDAKGARQFLVTSIRQMAELGERWWLGYAVMMLAMVAIAQEEPIRAARLLGAAATLRELRHGAVAPVLRPALENTIATVQKALGAEIFSARWQEGARMTLEQLLVYIATTDTT